MSSPCTWAGCPWCPATSLVLKIPYAACALNGKTNIKVNGLLQGSQACVKLWTGRCGHVSRDLVLQPPRHLLSFLPFRGMMV